MLKVVSYLLRRHYSNQNLSARGQKQVSTASQQRRFLGWEGRTRELEKELKVISFW